MLLAYKVCNIKRCCQENQKGKLESYLSENKHIQTTF